ncbi:MAG: hypothetical protein WBO34_07335 [Gammaproteobacteria bacterium]
MHNQQHPDTELLDRLRAGLLDDRPEEKAVVEQHLTSCEQCRTHTGIWQQLDPNALGPRMDGAGIGTALEAARRQALARSGNSHARRRSLLPYAAAATLVLAVTVGLWTSRPGIDTTDMVADTGQTVPDIYEDLDFYLWLANQHESATDNGNT